jgi:hypothetical protein
MTGKEQTADMIWDRVVEQIGSREGGASGDR